MSFTVVPMHGLDLGSGAQIPFGGGFVLQDVPSWLLADEYILAKIHLTDRQLIAQDKHALVAEYEAEALGSPDPQWPGKEPKSIQSLKFQSAMLANLAIWLRQPSIVNFTVGFHAVCHESGPVVIQTEHHTRLFCHPKDTDNPIELRHLVKAGELHQVLSTVPRQNAVWSALRAIWAALTSYRVDLRYPLFWQGMESLFGSEKSWKVTPRLCSRLSYFLAEDRTTQKELYAKIKNCYAMRSKIVHGRWEEGTAIDLLMADTENIARTALRHVLERPRMLETFISDGRDDFLEVWVQSRQFVPPSVAP